LTTSAFMASLSVHTDCAVAGVLGQPTIGPIR
jgi:hypothetical protein